MATFTPPVLSDNPPYDLDSTPDQVRLFRHFKPYRRYVVVYLLSDGTCAQDTATDGHPNTNVPQPYDPNYPNEPFSVAYSYDFTKGDFSRTDTYNHVWITQTFQGPTPVDAPTAALLTAAGYTVV